MTELTLNILHIDIMLQNETFYKVYCIDMHQT